MKLINVLLFFLTAQLVFGFAPESLNGSKFKVKGSYTFIHILHPDYYDVITEGVDFEYSAEFSQNKISLIVPNSFTYTYDYNYQKQSNTSASITIFTTYDTTIEGTLTFDKETKGSFSSNEFFVSKEIAASYESYFTFSQPLDTNNPNNWYLLGNYWHQPSSNKYVHKDTFLNGENYIKPNERKIINDTTIPADHLRWYKFANEYYWQQANDIYLTIEDYTEGNFNNVFKMSPEEVNMILNKDTSWYKFGNEYYNPKLNVRINENEVDSSQYADLIKTYFSNEIRSPYYGYKSQNKNQEVIADPKYTPVEKKSGFFLSGGWLYSPKHGWIFTNSQIYPYFWLNKTQSWYCYKTGEGSTMVYDYKLNNWILDF
jgi:hypothetical protein